MSLDLRLQKQNLVWGITTQTAALTPKQCLKGFNNRDIQLKQEKDETAMTEISPQILPALYSVISNALQTVQKKNANL